MAGLEGDEPLVLQQIEGRLRLVTLLGRAITAFSGTSLRCLNFE
jgi:hypothetical protein